MARVLYARSAQTDLLEAWLFITEENTTAADRVLDAIEHESEALSLQPLMGRARPELETAAALR
jgi:plasmid stabilization system protein ParE